VSADTVSWTLDMYHFTLGGSLHVNLKQNLTRSSSLAQG